MSADHAVTVLIGALGGQGGGVLADWLVEAARLDGYPAQATSIPGVAQRTGATTYYFELFPQKDPHGIPVFCLFPSAGEVDLVAAMEPTEAGRALEQGFVTDRTIVISTAQRVFSTAEKVIAGDGTVDPVPILQALEKAAQRLVQLDRTTERGGALNAILLGVIAGSGTLPIAAERYREAIRHRGVAVEGNIAAFTSGLDLAQQSAAGELARPAQTYQPAPEAFADPVAALPEPLRPLIGHGLARLVDYQDVRYAQRYLDRLEPIIRLDRDGDGEAREFALTRQVAHRLAAWMSCEDVIRVAQLKTRPGRFGRIRGELAAKSGEPVDIVDFLKPGRREIKAILPPRLARLIPDLPPGKPEGRPIRLGISSPFGFGVMRFLAALRPLRPASSGFLHEQRMIERWLECVRKAAEKDYDLGCKTAEVAVWTRGYGDVREHGAEHLEGLFSDWESQLEDAGALHRRIDESIHRARHDPDASCSG